MSQLRAKAGPAQENPFPGKLEIIGRVFYGGRGEDFCCCFVYMQKKKQQHHKDKYLLGAKCCARHLCFPIEIWISPCLEGSYNPVMGWQWGLMQMMKPTEIK